MDEHGMENEQLEYKISPNTEYLPTKCRVTKPPPPKPATNPLQFIKVAPPPLFQKAKEQVNKVEKIKKEKKETQEEAEDWQANLDNWKSSRRKLQEHIIERVVEVKKFEQEDSGRSRRKAKTFNEILEERGKSKYSIPIYVDELNDWSDYGISDSKNDQDGKTGERKCMEESSDQYSSDECLPKKDELISTISSPAIVKLNRNEREDFQTSIGQCESENSAKTGRQYTYEGAIEGYRSRIKSKIDDSILVNISEAPKRMEVENFIAKGEIVKKKELFDRQQNDIDNISHQATRVLQDFENSISIKQRLKCLEKCNDQSVKYVDNINIIPKVKQISQLFDKNYTDVKSNYVSDVLQNNNNNDNNNAEYNTQCRDKLNINIVPWSERDRDSRTDDIFGIDIFSDKNDLKEIENQSDDKSSDTFYSGLEDVNYPPSISSTDYMALSSDREDSGIHTADVSCSVSQADDTAEELESNTNYSHETVNDDFQSNHKCFKQVEYNQCSEENVLKLTKENISYNQSIPEIQENDGLVSNKLSFDSTVVFFDNIKKNDETEDINLNFTLYEMKESIQNDNEIEKKDKSHPSEIKNEILKNINNEIQLSDLALFSPGNEEYLFNSDFPLLPTKMVEPPKTKPPPPPPPQPPHVAEEKKPIPSVRRLNSTKRIKREITMKRSSFLGLSEPDEDIVDTIPDDCYSKIEKTSVEQLSESKFETETYSTNCNDVGDTSIDKMSVENIDSTPTKYCPIMKEDEITKQEREIIEMLEEAENFRDREEKEQEQEQIKKAPIPMSRTFQQSKTADASYHDKQPDFLEGPDSEVLKVEQELQQLEQEELKRKRDNLLFRQACSRVFSKNKRYSLENIFDSPGSCLEGRKSMPELQYMKIEKEPNITQNFKSIHNVDLGYRKSIPNIPGYYNSDCNRKKEQTIGKSTSEFQHDVNRSAFQVPQRKTPMSYECINSPKLGNNNEFVASSCDSLGIGKSFPRDREEKSSLVKQENRSQYNKFWLKTKPNVESKSYDQHWFYQEAEFRRLQDKNKFSCYKETEPSNFHQQVLPSHGNPKSSIRKLASVNNAIRPLREQPITQPLSIALEDNQNRILSVSGKKKCSFCGHELGRGAAMIIETLCLFYHMECFKCCVCNVQLGNGLNGTDVRVRNGKLHCHNCYSSDDGVKFSRV